MKIKLLVFILSIAFQFCHAQKESVKCERINAAEGLVNVFILDIFKDNDGNNCFGKEYSLNRYDGYSFVILMSKLDENKIYVMQKTSTVSASNTTIYIIKI